jgi:hypothetical protein
MASQQIDMNDMILHAVYIMVIAAHCKHTVIFIRDEYMNGRCK